MYDDDMTVCMRALCGAAADHSSVTVAPRSVNVFLSFSASSFERPSLSTFGSDSTNFFACRGAERGAGVSYRRSDGMGRTEEGG